MRVARTLGRPIQPVSSGSRFCKAIKLRTPTVASNRRFARTSRSYDALARDRPGQNAPQNAIQKALVVPGTTTASSPKVQPMPNLNNFEELQYQSDVTAPALLGPRLIDHPEHAEDFNLWTQLLDFRLRVDGIHGALGIWQGIQQRKLELPTSGEYATKLWSAIASVAIQYDILQEVWQYTVKLAQKTNRRYDGLYEWIIGHFLRTRPTQVMPWHRKFGEIGLPVAGSLSNLVDDAMCTKKSLTTFERLYNEANDHSVYDRMITCLCERGRYDEAVKWHRLLVKVDDLPSSASIADPLRDYLASKVDQLVLKEITNDLVEKGVSFAQTIPRTLNKNTKISREIMSRMLGESHGVTPKRIPDRFSARMFATRAFSVDFVIAGLTSFGFDVLGPLTMQELALRCKSAEDLTARIAQLEKLNVQLSPCTYVQLVRRLAEEGRSAMLDAIVQSDQHPEVYEDRKIQRQLLDQYIRIQDWHQVHRTLTILTAFHDDQESEGWNIMLRSHMIKGNMKMVHEVFNDMLLNGVRVTPGTLQCSFFKLLRPRNAGKRPISLSKHVDDLSFVTAMWLKILRFGGHVPAAAWNQIHNYYGMEGRLHELERLTLWLIAFYSRQSLSAAKIPSGRFTIGHRRRIVPSQTDYQFDLRRIFGHTRQSAIVSWSFKSIGWGAKKLARLSRLDALAPASTATNLGRYETWARGVALLRIMKQRGIPVHQATVRKAVRQRLLVLFGPGRSNRLDNRVAVAQNSMSLCYMVRYLNNVWKSNLLNVPLALLRMEGPDAERLLRRIVLGSHVAEHAAGLVRTKSRPVKNQFRLALS